MRGLVLLLLPLAFACRGFVWAGSLEPIPSVALALVPIRNFPCFLNEQNPSSLADWLVSSVCHLCCPVIRTCLLLVKLGGKQST